MIRTGDGTVRAAHGLLPVPAPATLKLLEGHRVSPGPEGAGELVTPTGAALVRVLSSGAPPAEYVPLRSGYRRRHEGLSRDGPTRCGSSSPRSMAEAGITVRAESVAALVACDVDDMSPEYLAAVADRARDEGALDAVLLRHDDEEGTPRHAHRDLCVAGA